VIETFLSLTRLTPWAASDDALPLAFDAGHPQGMVRIGDVWWISTVDARERRGWLLAADATDGSLLDRIPVGDDVRFHPGGMDFDGTSLWLACSEYKPHSTAIVERFEPGGGDRRAQVAFSVDDHVGAIVRLGPDGDLVGWTWGSRELLRWSVDGGALGRAENPDHFVDHQDGQWLEGDLVLCSGVGSLGLGGFALLRGSDLRVLRSVPFFHRSPVSGRSATQNPVFAEVVGDEVVVHLLPDDGDRAAIYGFSTPRR
jgi:hypothetical protein